MNRVVLCMDTATEVTVVAFGVETEDGRIEGLVGTEIDAPRAAMSRLLPTIDELARDHGVSRSSIGAVVVGRGPGSFTGVRIGVSAAKGLAQGLGVPLYGIGTLDTIAWAVVGGYTGLLGVVGDAMRGEVYPALFRVEERRAVRLSADEVATPAEAARRWSELAGSERILLTGNGLRKHASVFEEAIGRRATVAPEEVWRPYAYAALMAYEASTPEERGSGDPGELLPVYTRLSDAEENERARLGTRDGLPSTGVAGPAGSDATASASDVDPTGGGEPS